MDRDFILDEIRRTAIANGGRPLGMSRFEAETGIRRYDTEKYWARWGDALSEAGYQPNTLQQATPDEDVLRGLAALTRELGHLPTKRELRIYKSPEGSVPSYRVVSRVAPTKQILITRLLTYCDQHEGFDDVAAICGSYKTSEERISKVVGTVTLGEVYLIKSGRYYKIGYSVSAERRTREFQIQLPDIPRRVHTIRTDDPRGIEAYWHKRFEAKRVRPEAEFFKLDANDVKAFCAWKRIV
jgi:hypothetical protein